MTDRELLASYAADDSQEAFAEIVSRHAPMVYSACLRALGDAHAAEDASQAVFLVLAGKARKLPRATLLAGWLHRTAENVCRDARKLAERRRRHEREAAAMKTAMVSGGPRPEGVGTEARARLDAALAQLPEPQRSAVILRHVRGLSEAEVSAELGCGQGAAAMRVSRGLERLRTILAGGGVAMPAAALVGMLGSQAGLPVPAALLTGLKALGSGTLAAPASGAAAQLAEGTMKAMTMAKVKLAAAAVCSVLAVGGGGAAFVANLAGAPHAAPLQSAAAGEPSADAGAQHAAPLPAVLKDAAPNTWVKLVESKTGAREQPAFVWASRAGKFVAAVGQQATGGAVPRHYDTEEFDLTAARWKNAYPPGMEKDRPESGPVSEEYTKQRMMHGNSGGSPFYKDGDHLRPSAGGQWNNAKTYGEYCYVPEGGAGGTLYVCLWGKTLGYDVAGRTWKELGPGREKCRIWGSMAYDPINKEIVHAGGAGGSADVSTWAYDIGKNEWRKLEFGSEAMKKLHAAAVDLCWQAKVLLGRTASRHASAETAGEAKVDLPAEAGKLAAAAEKLAGEVAGAGLAGGEKTAGEVAQQRLKTAAAAVKAAGPNLSGAITPEKIAAVRSAREIFERAVDALSVEPPGRARSQIAFDAEAGKIVLFGGDGLDRALSDTWVYDCKTRAWEQRFPAKSPSPRAGHVMGWLPGAKRIVMAGGYSRTPLAQEIWTYDTGANAWTPLASVPGGKGANCPNVTAREFQAGAIAAGDVLVCPDGGTVWGCRIDPAKPAAGAEAAATAPEPGSYVWNTISPENWEKVARPDPAAAKKLLDELPVNQWTAFSFPKYAPGATNRWGTSAYDTDRHQFLLWGGGHATSHEDDVAHFAVLGGFWTIGYHPDDPIENVYAEQPTPLSFHDRRHVPIHAYRAYTYDPTAGKMFYFDRAYDPLVREWVPAPYPGLDHKGPMHSQMKATPAGAVTFSDKGLFRFDAKAGAWTKLAWNGAKPGGTWCDGPSMTYDSKRNCLWMAFDKDIFKYDFAAGNGEKLTPAKPGAVGKWLLMSETAYEPDADLILAMALAKRPDGANGTYAWDPNDGKFYWTNLKFVENGKDAPQKGFGFHDAMAYDPELKRCLINSSSTRKVWALKFDRKSANLEEMKGQ